MQSKRWENLLIRWKKAKVFTEKSIKKQKTGIDSVFTLRLGELEKEYTKTLDSLYGEYKIPDNYKIRIPEETKQRIKRFKQSQEYQKFPSN